MSKLSSNQIVGLTLVILCFVFMMTVWLIDSKRSATTKVCDEESHCIVYEDELTNVTNNSDKTSELVEKIITGIASETRGKE